MRQIPVLSHSGKNHSLNVFSLTIACLIALFCVSSPILNTAQAHELRPAIVDFTFDKNGIYRLIIRHNIEALLADIDPTHDNTSASANIKKYNQLRSFSAQALNAEFEKFSAKFLQKIQLSFDNKPTKLQILNINIAETDDVELARDSNITMLGVIPENTKNMSWKWDKQFGNAILRISSEDKPELFSSYLVNGNKSAQVPISVACYNNKNALKVEGCAVTQGKWDGFKNYLKVGFVHIIPKGLDHILFIVGLFLLSAQLRPLLIQITTFTLAHSVTLGLGIYGVVNVSASIIEPLIAASIVYICIENICSNQLSKWRTLVIFGFGLLHGLGFASVLSEIGLGSGSFIAALIAFNIGVEVGQLAVIAVCFLSFGYWLSHKSWYRKVITIPASTMIALMAMYWVLERTGFFSS